MLAAPDAALAARSGGRAGGGRSFSSRPAPSRASAPRTTVNNNYISGGGGGVRYMPSPVMGFGYSPFYSPFGGMGTGYALGSMAGGGQRYETNRLENEVRFWAWLQTVPPFFSSAPSLLTESRAPLPSFCGTQVTGQQKDLATVDKELAVQKEKNAELEARLLRLESK
jgi:hypothetical protein